MQKINMAKIIKDKQLGFETTAKILYPENKHPVNALHRLIRENKQLNAAQISRLAMYLGCSESDLFTEAGWTAKSKGRTHILTSGEYEAHLNTETWTVNVFYKGSIMHERLFVAPVTSLKDFTDFLNTLINNKPNQ